MNIIRPTPTENPDQRTITTAPSEVTGAVADQTGSTALGLQLRVRAAASDDQEVHQ